MHQFRGVLTCVGLVGLWAAVDNESAAAHSKIVGYLDTMTAQYAVGWACVPNAATRVDIAIYAGPSLVGVFPTPVSRPDVTQICGSGASPHGFSVWFTQTMQAAFAGQTALSIYAYTNSLPATLLPPSSSGAVNPYALPSGSLADIGADGTVSGEVISASAKPPTIAVYSGAPAAQGGASLALGSVTTLGNGVYEFTVPAAEVGWQGRTPKANIPVYGYAEDSIGTLVPLMSPTYMAPPGLLTTQVSLNNVVSQSGAVSGISNSLFTAWLPSNVAVGALSGTLSLTGNDPTFSEALVLVGTTGDDQAACAAKNNTSPNEMPSISRIWAAILKRNGNGTETIPVNLALPYGLLPISSATGTCLLTGVSAGYPFLNAGSAKYAQTSVQLTATFNPAPQAAPSIIPLGIGGEFKFDTRAATNLYTYVGIVANKKLMVDSVAGSVSAAPVAGAPSGSNWLPNPHDAWSMDTAFTYIPQSSCQTAGFNVQPLNAFFSTIRMATPSRFSLPIGALSVLDMPLFGAGTTAVQTAPFKAFASTAQGASAALTLNTGDCLIALAHSTLPGSAAGGMLDYENQSTVFFRLSQ